MKKHKISQLFLYRHRFIIGYELLALAFIALLIFLPGISPNGLSSFEMESAITSSRLNFSSIFSGEIADLPYHLLQKLSISLFGLTPYAIKIPSILIGLVLGIILILLLNRWFKNNVALLASILTILSVPFLYTAGSGTPLIMFIFWPTFLLWLGSKIQGKTSPRPAWCFIFAFSLLLSIFTPFMIYLVAFICFFAIYNPHLRFTIKSLPKPPLIASSIIIAVGVASFILNLLTHHITANHLLFSNDFSISKFIENLNLGFIPFFSWSGKVESIFLSPLIGLPVVALAIAGLLSTVKGFFASRNSIASYLIVFTVILTGLNPHSAILLVLPLAILVAHGLRYILEKWYGLFPENPYARIFAILPISIFLGIIIISDISHFIFGYRYNPSVANQFTNDLTLIRSHIPENTTLLLPGGTIEYDFYKILEEKHPISIVSEVPQDFHGELATFGKWIAPLKKSKLSHIITSSKSTNSDRIYIYTVN